MHNFARVERVLSEARHCRFQERCLLWQYAHHSTPTVFSDDWVHCLAYHEIFDIPEQSPGYYEGLAWIYTNSEHEASCEANNVREGGE